MSLAEATGGDENFYAEVQLVDKRTFRWDIAKGNKNGIPPNVRAAESQNHKL